MEKLGGGGHRTIAGAQLPGATVEEAKEKVKGVIDMMLEKEKFKMEVVLLEDVKALGKKARS